MMDAVPLNVITVTVAVGERLRWRVAIGLWVVRLGVRLTGASFRFVSEDASNVI
jgi:hypothetical protein